MKTSMMGFVAGLTVTGIIGLLLLEALKILMVPIAVWVMGLLALALKVVMLGALVVLGIGFFLYRRSQREGARA
jgi:hypothetical protein